MSKMEFGVSLKLDRLYYAYLGLVILSGFVWWLVPLVFVYWFLISPFSTVIVILSGFVPLVIVTAVTLYWIPRFVSSINYILGDDEIIVTKGVWWKTTGVVPYNRITNVNIYQGPLSRRFGLGRLAIQTAGYSGGSSSGQSPAEANIFGITNFEEIKDRVMDAVKGIKPVATEAEAEPSKSRDDEIVQELRRIRKAVEKHD
jgi:membrane protein YdbS with pleckstrin-like domain